MIRCKWPSTAVPSSPVTRSCTWASDRTGDKLAKGTVIRNRLAVLSLPFAPQGEYTWLPEYKRYWNSNLLAEDVREKMGLAGPPAYQITPRSARCWTPSWPCG